MELRHLRYFLAVAEELHFGRAADRLQIAQPPLSRQIRALETELGVRLLARTRRGVQLTDAGRVFRDEARAALARAERAVHSVRRAARGEVGGIAIAFAPAVALSLIPRLVPHFLERHAEVRLDVRCLEAEEQVGALRDGSIEVGIAPTPFFTNGDAVVEQIASEELCAVLPEKHRLARHAGLAPALLAEEPFVLLTHAKAPRLAELVFGMFREAGMVPRVHCQASDVSTCLALVAAGAGVSVMSAGTRGVCASGVVFRPLGPSAPKMTIGMIRRRAEVSALARDFVAVTRTTLRSGATTLECGGREKVARIRAPR